MSDIKLRNKRKNFFDAGLILLGSSVAFTKSNKFAKSLGYAAIFWSISNLIGRIRNKRADADTGIISINIAFVFENQIAEHDRDDYVRVFANNVYTKWQNFTYNNNRVQVDTSGFIIETVIFADDWDKKNFFPPNTFCIRVGDGSTDPRNPTPGTRNTNGISYVDYKHKKGYFYYTPDPQEAAHEFGHMVGLQDRYVEMYDFINYRGAYVILQDTRATYPIILPLNHPDSLQYNRDTNLMSKRTISDTPQLTDYQLSYVFSSDQEPSVFRPTLLFYRGNSNENAKPSIDAVWIINDSSIDLVSGQTFIHLPDYVYWIVNKRKNNFRDKTPDYSSLFESNPSAFTYNGIIINLPEYNRAIVNLK